MGSPKKSDPPPPPQPDAPAAKTLLGAEDSPAQAVKKRKTNANALKAAYLTAPASGVGVQI